MKKLILLSFFTMFLVRGFSQTVYINENGSKYYHATKCHCVKSTSTAMGVNNAILMGYKPCKDCNPPKAQKDGKKKTIKYDPKNNPKNNPKNKPKAKTQSQPKK